MDGFNVKSLCLFTICIVSNVNVGVARPEFRNEAKIVKSGVKQNDTSPLAISSRFLDLGGVISQLFSGFNQGSGGGSGTPGLNYLPPNSQLYPGVPAQNSNNLPPPNRGKDWSPFNQGNYQKGNLQNQQQWNQPYQNANANNNLQPNLNQGGIENQQQWNRPNQNTNKYNNLQSNPIQGGGISNQQPLTRPNQSPNTNNPKQWLNFGQNFNNQNKNLNPSQTNFKQGTQTGQMTNAPWYPNQGNTVNNSPHHSNEGTLDDFFKGESTTQFGNQFGDGGGSDIFRDKDESTESPVKTALWGKQVRVPSTTPSDNIVFRDSHETPSQKECVQNCPTSSEYSPVCGTDGVSYFNPARLICARNCGIDVFEARQGNCGPRPRG